MRQTSHVCAVVLCFLAAAYGTLSQERRTTPALELLNTATLADARASEQGFEIHAVIKLEPEKAAEVEGTYLLVWTSPTRWREEFSVSDFHQVRVGAPGGVWEKREPYFLSLRMWQLMQALNSYGRMELPREESAGKIKRSKKNGEELRCIEIARHSPVREFCFHEDVPQLASEHYLPSDRHYEFADYRTIRTKFFPGHITVYEGKTLAATFSVSKVEETDSILTKIFEQPAQSEWRSWCASPEAGGDPLTPIYSQLVEHKTISTLYGAIGTDGQLYRFHVLESGGPRHDEEVLEALKRERWKPTLCNAVPITVETVFRR